MKNLLVLLVLVLSFNGNSQLSQSKFNLYGKYSVGYLGTASYQDIGLTGEWLVHEKVGILYNFDLTYRSDNFRQIHAPMGLVGGPLVMGIGLGKAWDGDSTTNGGLILVGVLMLLVPEGVSYHQPLGYRWDISPYANLLGLDFIKNRTNGEKFIKYSCSFGVRGTYVWREKFTLSPFIETRKAASVPWGIGGGLGIGVLFGKRDAVVEEE